MAFFRKIFNEVAEVYPDIERDYLYVDAAAQALVLEPDRFDVIVTENLFGDILSDLGGATVGGIGVCAGANIGDHYAYFEPIHGSAPSLAGLGTANPLATILAGGLMLNYLGLEQAATTLEQAIEKALLHRKIVLLPNGATKSGTKAVVEALTTYL